MPGRTRATTPPASVRVGSTANSAGATTAEKRSAAPSQSAMATMPISEAFERGMLEEGREASRLSPHDARGAREEHVRRALVADRRQRSVARIDDRGIIELAEARERELQLVGVAEEQVGTADRAREQRVAAEDDTLVAKGDVSRRMS